MLNENPTRPTAPSQQRAYNVLLIGLFAVLQVMIVAVAFMGGYLFRDWDDQNVQFSPRAILQPDGGDFPVLNEAAELLQKHAYADLPDQKQLEYGAIRGLLQAFNDPYTSFLEPPQHELQVQQLQGHFGGIGVRIERDAENLVYLYLLPDSPAGKAGVQDGDRLLGVEDMPVTAETTNDEIQSGVRGPVGEKVKITVGHAPDYAPVDLIIERAEVPLPSVTWNLVPEKEQVGVVHIHIIADTTPDEVTKAIKDLQSQGAARFIIDVRNNGGGLVEAGVNTARLFLKDGMVIEQQYRGEDIKTYKVEKPGEFADLPIVVLINGGTASSAEIFAGAIQGQKRAQIVGTHSYGKDSIQMVFSLADGSSLHVTSAKWWVPNLEPVIGGNGLQPDIPIAEDASDADALHAAVEAVLSK